MKTAIFDNKASVTAAANLTAKYLIGFDGNVCGANAKPLGVSLADTDTGYECPVQIGGIAVVLAGGSFSIGDPLVSSAAGKVVAATTFAAAAPAITVDATKLEAAAQVITIDDTKLTVDADVTPVTSSAANGAIITAASGFATNAPSAITAASGFLTPAAPALTGSVLPQAIVGYALDAGSDGAYVRVKLV